MLKRYCKVAVFRAGCHDGHVGAVIPQVKKALAVDLVLGEALHSKGQGSQKVEHAVYGQLSEEERCCKIIKLPRLEVAMSSTCCCSRPVVCACSASNLLLSSGSTVLLKVAADGSCGQHHTSHMLSSHSL